MREGFPIEQTYFLMGSQPQNDVPLGQKRLWSSVVAARSIAAGHIYDDPDYPDVALGMADGQVLVFANLGNDEYGNHTGFQYQQTLDVGLLQCQIRDIKIASLYPCTRSIICAMTCGPGKEAGNYMFTMYDQGCDATGSVGIARSDPRYEGRMRRDPTFEARRSRRKKRRRPLSYYNLGL